MNFYFFIHVFFPFDAVFSIFLYAILKRLRHEQPKWQQEVEEFDVLASIARLKVENPEFNFLQNNFIVETHAHIENGTKIKNMGHPLLSCKKRIVNSLLMEKSQSVVLLTGSNMAGKSTFLRAFATNMLFYNMGAPVCADVFSVAHCKVLCAIRIDDSLAEGTSYFYAEVKRIAEILLELKTSGLSCLFFIDEIFKGTNNKERYLGALAILKSLLSCGHFGFVSTHDLALTDLAQNDTRLRNMHFADHLDKGELSFDYKLKEGPSPTTNALFIMRQAGLEV